MQYSHVIAIPDDLRDCLFLALQWDLLCRQALAEVKCGQHLPVVWIAEFENTPVKNHLSRIELLFESIFNHLACVLSIHYSTHRRETIQ